MTSTGMRARLGLRFLDWMLRQMDELRPETVSRAQGEVLEVGFGTALNLRHYGAGVKSLTGLDPLETQALPAVEERIARAAFPVTRAALRADAALPFDSARFDCVVTTWTLCSIPDPLAALVEMRRVLKPGGRYLFNVWGSLEANPVSLVVADAVAACFPQDPPQFFRRTPYGHFDQAPIRRELEAAGFPKVDAQTVAKHTQASARDAAFGLCQGSPLRNEIEARDPKGLDKATEAAARAIAARFGEGPIDNRMQAIVFEAVRPH
jgi:SAM-dependent methyltransferase